MNGANQHGTAESMKVLNRLLVTFQYSLASYLGYARPWTHAENVYHLAAVRRITAEHEAHARRIGALVLRRRGIIEPGRFPTRFTGYNDLALDYLAPWLVEHERELIDEIARSVARLGGDPEARRLSETILAVERVHLRTLTQLVLTSLPKSEHPARSLAA